MTDIAVKFTIEGYIWHGNDRPVTISVYSPEYQRSFYMRIGGLTDKLRARAAEKGITLGELVDELNAKIERRAPPPLVSLSWTSLTAEQSQVFGSMLKDSSEAIDRRLGDCG